MKDALVPPRDVDEVDVLDYLAVLWGYRGLIVGILTTVIGATFVFTVTTPKRYESTATLVAPKESPAATGFLGSLAASGLTRSVPGLANFSASPNRDLLVAILKSRTMGQTVVE